MLLSGIIYSNIFVATCVIHYWDGPLLFFQILGLPLMISFYLFFINHNGLYYSVLYFAEATKLFGYTVDGMHSE